LFSPTGQVQKGISELNKLQKIIRGQILSPSDFEIAKELIRDLQNALGG
jgi:hypothetical protein